MIIHGVPIEKIKTLSNEEWESLDSKTKEEYELILSCENMLPPDFIDKKNQSRTWESDFIIEYTFT